MRYFATLLATETHTRRPANAMRNDPPIHRLGQAVRGLRSNTDAIAFAHRPVAVASAADTPGSWVPHCHVIEHQKTGLTSHLRVA